jgi:hypothetical protein
MHCQSHETRTTRTSGPTHQTEGRFPRKCLDGYHIIEQMHSATTERTSRWVSDKAASFQLLRHGEAGRDDLLQAGRPAVQSSGLVPQGLGRSVHTIPVLRPDYRSRRSRLSTRLRLRPSSHRTHSVIITHLQSLGTLQTAHHRIVIACAMVIVRISSARTTTASK